MCNRFRSIHESLIALCALERRTARGGRDSIDHPPMGTRDMLLTLAREADGMSEDEEDRMNEEQFARSPSQPD
jgi:hypothetical protein